MTKNIIFINKNNNSKKTNHLSKINLHEDVIETENYKPNKTNKMKSSNSKIKIIKKEKKILRKIKKSIKNKTIKNIMIFNDEEINNLFYKLAILYDKRTFCEYYISLLKINHILISSFINDEYNSKIIKFDPH